MFGVLHNLRKTINDALERSLGYRLYRVPNAKKEVPSKPGISHGIVWPGATYSPWLDNKAFQSVFAVANQFTLVDQYRLYELYELATQAARFGGDFLEVGVWRGGSSAVIQKAIHDSSTGSSRPRLFIADTFRGVAKAGGEHDTEYRGGEHSDASVSHVKELFTKAALQLPEILVGIFPDDHPAATIDKISFLHSDVDAYESTKGVVEWCLPRLTSDAILVFDDYGYRGCEGVTKYVNDFAKQHANEFVLVHNLNGHAVLVKR